MVDAALLLMPAFACNFNKVEVLLLPKPFLI